MRRRYVGTALLIVVTVALLAVLGFYVKPGETANSVAVLRTTGMTCGSCSERITKALGKVRGVANAEVDVAGGWVIVGYNNQSVKPELLAQKVGATGFYSQLYQVLTPAQFKQVTGRNIGEVAAATSGGCCGGKEGGCGQNQKK